MDKPAWWNTSLIVNYVKPSGNVMMCHISCLQELGICENECKYILLNMARKPVAVQCFPHIEFIRVGLPGQWTDVRVDLETHLAFSIYIFVPIWQNNAIRDRLTSGQSALTLPLPYLFVSAIARKVDWKRVPIPTGDGALLLRIEIIIIIIINTRIFVSLTITFHIYSQDSRHRDVLQ